MPERPPIAPEMKVSELLEAYPELEGPLVEKFGVSHEAIVASLELLEPAIAEGESTAATISAASAAVLRKSVSSRANGSRHSVTPRRSNAGRMPRKVSTA